MKALQDLGPLCVAEERQGHRVPIAVLLSIGDVSIPAPQDPHLLLVPANVTYLQQMWDALRMPSRNNLLITGESGSGKTLLIRFLGECYRQVMLHEADREHDPAHAAHLRDRAAFFQTRILTFHENLRRSDITERRHYGEKGEEKTGWNMSDVMDGMVTGDWNVLSEINRTGEDVQAEFNEPLENKAKTLHQQVIRGHPNARFIATINPVKSEGRGIYEGKVMSGEFMNRFTNKVHIRYLPPDQEFEVLKDYGPDLDDMIIERLIALANDIRRDYGEEHGVVPFPITTRALIRIVRHLERFPDDRLQLRSLFWRKAYWLDDRIHPQVAVRLVENLLDLHDIIDRDIPLPGRSGIFQSAEMEEPILRIGSVESPLGPGGPYVPDTVIEEVQQNIVDLEWILKDIVLQENILLIGEAGVGKNKLESYLAHLLRWNLLVIGMSGETRVSDLLTYRSFGEEEEGKTGDTATLGLKALTDELQRWLIVLDEANKAQQGVLVSFNDLLQDRIVRLPGGVGAPVRASICVNINPNRPPYEVNDFSFDFMDRFSIHTIVHLPADQAVAVLKKKYPEADIDFIQDIVRGFYHLHPLYSGGVLFEPVTMRNEEAAIERGLQYPLRAFNIIELITEVYGPKEGRETDAIRSVLEVEGFDRNILAARGALAQFQMAWEEDPESEEKALSLSGTYRAIGKPTAALEVHTRMLSRHPGRDWLHHLRRAWILLDSDATEEAEREIIRGFSVGDLVRLNNGEEYRILSSRVKIEENSPKISVEAIHMRTKNPVLIVSARPDLPKGSVFRSSGEFLSTYVDSEGLTVYEFQEMRVQSMSGSLSGDILELTRLAWTDADFHLRICQLPIPLWKPPVWSNGVIIRELICEGESFRLFSYPGKGWQIDHCILGENQTDRWHSVISWMKGSAPGSGELSLSSQRGDIGKITAPTDPYIHLAFSESRKVLYIVLKSDIATILSGDGKSWSYSAGKMRICILTSEEYRNKVLSPLITAVYPRLDRLFRFTRTVSGPSERGVGDAIYTIQSDSGITISLLTGMDGMGAVFLDLNSGGGDGVERDILNSDPLHRRTVIPFQQLDPAEERQERALSPETQVWLQEIRRYIAAALFDRTQSRDPVYEAKARAILSGYSHIAEPLENAILHPGDILVRRDSGSESENRPRSVFIVRFLQQNTNISSDGSAVVRGFLLAQQDPVVTERLDTLIANFCRIIVAGDDLHHRIVHKLAADLHASPHPWQFFRTGNRFDPVDTFEFCGLELEYRPMNRRFRLTITGINTDAFSIEETGYPTGITLLTTGNREPTRWPGGVIVDIFYIPEMNKVCIVLEDDLLSVLLDTHAIADKEPIIGSDGVVFEFFGRSESGW
jgi:MoxR-like ATPase